MNEISPQALDVYVSGVGVGMSVGGGVALVGVMSGKETLVGAAVSIGKGTLTVVAVPGGAVGPVGNGAL